MSATLPSASESHRREACRGQAGAGTVWEPLRPRGATRPWIPAVPPQRGVGCRRGVQAPRYADGNTEALSIL